MKLPQKVSAGKRSLSIIHAHCRLCILLVNGPGRVSNSRSPWHLCRRPTRGECLRKGFSHLLFSILAVKCSQQHSGNIERRERQQQDDLQGTITITITKMHKRFKI